QPMFPRAEYDSHPAFAPFCRRALAADGFATMNGVTDEIVSEFVLTNGRHKDLIAENVRKYDEVLRSDSEVDHRLVEPLKRAFRSAHQKLINEKTARAILLNNECSSTASYDNARKLYQSGYFLAQVPTDMLGKLRSLLAKDMNAQRKTSEQGGGEINYVYPQ